MLSSSTPRSSSFAQNPGVPFFMVGDQDFTDVAGANLAGIRSVKVRTVRPDSFPIAVRSLHIRERFIFRVLTLAKLGV